MRITFASVLYRSRVCPWRRIEVVTIVVAAKLPHQAAGMPVDGLSRFEPPSAPSS